MLEINKVYNEDCIGERGMALISDGSVDMVLCDLPYGTTQNKWDSVIPMDVLWKHYGRIVKPTGAIVLFAQTPFDKVLGVSNLKSLKYEFIWEKEAGTGFLNAKKMPLKSHENILVFYKKPPVYNPQMTEGKPYECKKGGGTTNYNKDSKDNIVTINEGLRYPKTVLRFNRDKDKVHPTQKPVALGEYLIRTYTNEGDVILDNTCGVGSFPVAALNTGRNFIGFETDKGYYDVACERVRKAQETLANVG